MQILKREVQIMLDQTEQEPDDKVMRSTTRHYLERIKTLSVELPESLEGIKEAA